MNNIILVEGRHTLMRDVNNDIIKSEKGELLIYDKMNNSLLQVSPSPEVLSFFNLNNIISEDPNAISEETQEQIYSLDSGSNNNDVDSSKGTAVWDDKSVKLLFAVYKDHLNDFKSTCIKSDTVWDKVKRQINANGYNFTKTQIKDKWMNMRKNYVRVKDHNKQTGAKLKTYRYYDEMDDLYGNKPNINPVAVASNMRANENICSSSEDNAIENDEPKRKKSKVEHTLSSWTEKFIQHSKEQADRREQRQVEKIAAIESATKTFKDMMEKLLEKF